MYDLSIPAALQERVRQELAPGERIEWLATPKAVYFTRAATVSFLFAIPWTAFTLFWITGAAFATRHEEMGLFSFFPLFGLPFLLIGLGMLSSPLWSHRRALKTVYAITDQRAIIIEGGWTTTIRSFTPQQLGEIYRREHRNGLGDIIIARRQWRDTDNNSGSEGTVWRDIDGNRRSEEIGFLRIANAQEVERRLRALAEQRSQQ